MLMRLRGGMADEADPAAAMGSSPQAYSDGSTFRLQRDGRVEVYRVRLLIPLEGADMGVRAYIYQDDGGGVAATGSEADAIGRMVAADTLQEAARAGIIPARYLNVQSHEIIVEDFPPVTRPVYGPWPEHWYPRQAAEPEAPAAAAAAAATIPVATAVAVEAPAGTRQCTRELNRAYRCVTGCTSQGPATRSLARGRAAVSTAPTRYSIPTTPCATTAGRLNAGASARVNARASPTWARRRIEWRGSRRRSSRRRRAGRSRQSRYSSCSRQWSGQGMPLTR
jgi:hypothetical protein